MSDDLKAADAIKTEEAAPVEKSEGALPVEAILEAQKKDSAAQAEKRAREEGKPAPEKEAEAAPEEEAEVEETPAEIDEEPSVPPELRGHALRLGLDDQTINALGAERLGNLMGKLADAVRAAAKPAEAAAKPDDKPAAKKAAKVEDDLAPIVLSEDLADFLDEKALAPIQALVAKVNKIQVAEKARREKDATATVEGARADEKKATEVFDEMISDLGDLWKPVFGEGTYDDIDKKGKEFANRQDLDDMIRAVHKRSVRRGIKMTDGQLVQASLNALFPERTAKTIERKLSKKLLEAEEEISAPPAHRRSEPHGDAGALAAASKFAAENLP